MAISRSQLAAALVEYDNDQLHPSQRRNHRQSALFSGPVQRSPPEPQISPPRARRDHAGPSARSSGHAQLGDRTSHHDHQNLDLHRISADSHPQGGIPDNDIDVSRWDLPAHLVSTDTASSSAQRIPFPSARSGTALSHITTKSVSTPVPAPEYSPVQARAVSIHLDREQPFPPIPAADRDAFRPNELDGARRRTVSFDIAHPRRRTYSSDHLSSADAALAAAERARSLAEGVNALPPRSQSVMGITHGADPYLRSHRVSEPIIIPLPDSPLSAIASGGRPISIQTRRSFDLDRTRSPLEAFMEDEVVMDEPYYISGHDGSEQGQDIDDTPNPFALPAPPASQASRFDPKYARSELSLHSAFPGQPVSPGPSLRDLPGRPGSMYSLHPGASSSHRLSAISASSAAAGDIAPMLDQPPRPTFAELPTPETFGRPLVAPKYARRPPTDRHSLMRPKQLIMPSSLSSAELAQEAQSAAQREKAGRAGFTLGEVPLPREARSSILSMGLGTGDGRGIDGKVFGAGLAGELRMQQEEMELEDRRQEEMREALERKRERLPGKLYGTSLMDQLEARKQYTKNKSRVFTGDSRPSMFARQSHHSSSHLSQIADPGAAPMDSSRVQGSSPDKRLSLRPPLIQFDPNDPSGPADADPANMPRMSKSKSVFGVDQLWEKEMAKLKIMQQEEEDRRIQQEQAEKDIQAQEREKEARRKKGWLGKGKDKGKGKARDDQEAAFDHDYAGDANRTGYIPFEPGSGSTEKEYAKLLSTNDISPVRKSSDLPPMLSYSPEKASMAVPQPDAVPAAEIRRRAASRAGLDGWSSDDEEGYVRVWNAKPKQSPEHANAGQGAEPDDDEGTSEDDVPLSRMVPGRPDRPSRLDQQRQQQIPEDSDSDEDVPLSRLGPTRSAPMPAPAPQIQLNSDIKGSLGLDVPALPPSISPRPPTIAPPVAGLKHQQGAPEEDDDDKPLGLRSAAPAPPGRTDEERAEIEDDLPLAFKHAKPAQRHPSASAPAQYIPQTMYGGPSPGPMGMNAFSSMQFSPYGPVPAPMQMQMMYSAASMYDLGGFAQPIPAQYPGYGGIPYTQQGMIPPSHPSAYFNSPPGGALQSLQGGMGPSMMDFAAPGGFGAVAAAGQNIDSWRKGVRAPSTVGGESGR